MIKDYHAQLSFDKFRKEFSKIDLQRLHIFLLKA